MDRLFKRKIYSRLLQWKQQRAGHTAVLVEGARRVGKSTIVREFVQNEYETYIFIDFGKASTTVAGLFNDLSDLDYLFLQLQLAYNVTLHERKSAIVFDEVQLQPKARQAIKYLVADGRYDYIETGSLISIQRNVRDILIPSEESILRMYPMDYEEFRWAMGDETTLPLLRQVMKNPRPLGDAAHRKLMRDFRIYMLVGGMPQAVNEYLDKNDLAQVDMVKREILELYGNDFRKFDSTGRASLLFNHIPGQLSGNASRYQVSSAVPGSDLSRLSSSIADLCESMTVNVSYRVCDPNVGMALTRDMKAFKMFAADTGLFVTLAFADKDFTENVIYRKLMGDKLKVNLGYVYENVVAQMLVASGNDLYYSAYPTPDGKHNYEIDFLLSRGDKICPIEVKSSGYKSHVSMDDFSKKYASRIDSRYIVYTKDIYREHDLLYIPVYMAGLI